MSIIKSFYCDICSEPSGIDGEGFKTILYIKNPDKHPEYLVNKIVYGAVDHIDEGFPKSFHICKKCLDLLKGDKNEE